MSVCIIVAAHTGCDAGEPRGPVGPSGVPGGVWRPLSVSGAPSSRALHASVWTGSELLVWGGLAPGRGPGAHLGDGGRYDPATDTWRPLPATGAPSARARGSAVWSGSEMILFGGEDRYEHAAADGAAYDPVADRWRSLDAEGAPSPRLEHTAVWSGSEMIVFGGRDQTSLLERGAAYTPATDTWRPLATAGTPAPRRLHGAVLVGDEMMIYGGSTYDIDRLIQEVPGGALYDPARDTWRPVASAGAPHARAYFSLVDAGPIVIVLGEVSATRSASYDPAHDVWTPLEESEMMTGRGGAGVVWTGELLLVFGGLRLGGDGTSETALGDGALYSPQARRWTALSAEDAPSPRKYVTPHFTGSEVLVFGGADDGNVLGTGGAWRP